MQDHERALGRPEPRAAMKKINVNLLGNDPKCSQDLNPIEQCWRKLRVRFLDAQPLDKDARVELVQRLRSATSRVNRNRPDWFLRLCARQRHWAQDVLDARGAQTNH